MEPGSEPLRFTDILTTSSAVANFQGAALLTAAHVLDAIALLEGAKSLADLGRPVPAFSRRPGFGDAGAEPGVRAVVQRWFAELNHDYLATFTPDQLQLFRAQIAALIAESTGS
jgi:hypothetical protein